MAYDHTNIQHSKDGFYIPKKLESGSNIFILVVIMIIFFGIIGLIFFVKKLKNNIMIPENDFLIQNLY